MKIIYKIAKLELSVIIFTPVAWILSVFFILQSSIPFFTYLKELLKGQKLGEQFDNITLGLFSVGGFRFMTAPLFWDILNSLFLYIPLITMGLLSREFNSGSIKLLFSSPVKTREIVLGKYLAMMAYGAFLVFILGLIGFISYVSIRHMDVIAFFCNLLGIYLVICVYAAIGLFISSLTSYQVVTAILTLASLTTLNYADRFWHEEHFLCDIAQFLSIKNHAGNLMSGLVVSSDVFYFIFIIGMFLAFTLLKLYYSRVSVSIGRKIVGYGGVLLTTLLAGYVISQESLKKYYDLTATQQQTLTANSQKILKKIKGQLIINTYDNYLSMNYSRLTSPWEQYFDLQFWSKYKRFVPDLKINYINFYNKITPSRADFISKNFSTSQSAKLLSDREKVNLKDFKTPDEINKIINLLPENNQSIREIVYQGRHIFLRYADPLTDFLGKQPSEGEVAAAIKLLFVPRPVVAFLIGHQERSINKGTDKDYQLITNMQNYRKALINQGFNVLDLSIKDSTLIPTNLAALVIADPKTSFSAGELQKISVYISGGGNLLIAGEPGRQQNLNPILAKMGIGFAPGILIQDSKNTLNPDLILAEFTNAVRDFKDLQITNARISLSGAVALYLNTQSDFIIKPVLITDKLNTWNKANYEKSKNQKSGFLFQKLRRKKDRLNCSLAGSKAGAIRVIDLPMGAGSSVPATNQSFTSPQSAMIRDNNNNADNVPYLFDNVDVSYNPQKGDLKSAFPVALSLTRKICGKEQRIMVIGDADFLSNRELNRLNVSVKNLQFTQNLFRWFTYGEFPVDVSRKSTHDDKIIIDRARINFYKLILVYIIPSLFILIGITLIKIRQSK